MRCVALLLLLLPLAASCATSGTSEVGSNRSVITAEELEGVVDLMTLDAIRRLRPNWLRTRAAPTPAAFRQGGVEPALRVDGIMRPSLEELQSLPVRDVQEIAFLTATEATTLYGTGYTNGIIQVRTR